MIEEIRHIAQLQPLYSSDNTPEMQLRGTLIRKDLPKELKKHQDVFEASLGRFSQDMDIEGSDGIGRKTQAPWVRVFSRGLSPSATTGFYMVIHFSTDGTSCFVTLGCGASKWDSDKRDLVRYSDNELHRKVTWAKNILAEANADTSYFSDQITIGSDHALPKSFEKATVLCRQHSISTLSEDALVESISRALRHLAILYDHYAQLSDLSESDISAIQIESVVNPGKKYAGSRQGYGLTGPERRAVELRAMDLTLRYLSNLGYKVKDKSASESYDFLATKGGVQLKVEVKGTTSSIVDSIMMTSNEVDLHASNPDMTALSIVSGIRLTSRGRKPFCEGGEIEFIYPWKIADWGLIPKAFLVTRPKESLNKAGEPIS